MLIFAVLCAPALATASEIRENQPFLVSSINNTHPFVGQEVLLTYRLYFSNVAPKISEETAPSLQGLWARQTEPERFIKSIPVTVQGKQFRGAVVKQFRLVPIQSGRITISGYNMLCTLLQEHADPDGKELPENRIRITAPAITISAQNLPEPVPEKLSGAVGSFSINLITDKQNLRIGEPLSLKLILTGTGSLFTLELPDIVLPESFRHNPAERTTSLTKDAETTSGTITATIIAWPQSAGDFQIPALSLVVFNPETRQFSTIHSNELSIRVLPAEQGAGEEKPFDTSTEKKRTTTPPFIAIGMGLLVLMSAAAIVLVRKKRLHDAANPGTGSTGEHPPENGKTARTMKQQLFSLLVEAGIQSPEGMTRKELNEALQEINISDETRSELTTALDSLDRILYTPAREKESRIPERITITVNTLLAALKKAGSSR
jgi:hypothetical protein